MPQPVLDYGDFQVADAPPWQQGPMGQGWNEAFGLIKDPWAAGIRLAVKCRFPDFCPADGLDALGWTLQIDRTFLADDNTFRAAMKNAWVNWSAAGTVPGMTAILTQAGFANVAIWESWYWSDGNPSYYFTITCSLPTPWNSFPQADGTWGDGNPAKTWSDGGVWASGIPWPLRLQLKALVDKWKPLHAVCAAVIVNLGAGKLWGMGGHTWGDGGVWGGGLTLYINLTC